MMNTFYIYMLPVEKYTELIENPDLNDNQRRIQLNNHLLVSGTNRRIITMILRQNGFQIDDEFEMPAHGFDVHVFPTTYEQIQEVVQEEVRMAAGHFSHTLHKINLAAFYYLSFNVNKALTLVLIRNELPEGMIERNNWEGISPTMNRFYQLELSNLMEWERRNDG